MNLLSSTELTRSLADFFSGTLMLGYVVEGVFFLRSWKWTQDRLFLLFAIAFLILGTQRTALFISAQMDKNRSALLYGIRLVAFLLFLAAISTRTGAGRFEYGGIARVFSTAGAGSAASPAPGSPCFSRRLLIANTRPTSRCCCLTEPGEDGAARRTIHRQGVTRGVRS